MDKRFLSILAVIILIFVGFIVLGNKSKDSSNSGASTQATNHITGEGQKDVTLVEYGDYQCPVCAAYEPIVKQVVAKYKKDIYFQFRNLPLVGAHPNAFAAARAAEAASLQNKFWEMHDKLYETQDPSGKTGWVVSNSPISFFSTYAKEIDLNVEQFKQDFAASKVNTAINADLDEFKKTGRQQATPTFFINGRVLENKDLSDPQTGRPSVEKFSDIIDAEIAKKSS